MGAGDDDIARGKLEQAKGRVKKAIGELLDDPERKDDGTIDKAKGTVREIAGRVKNEIERELEDS